MTQDPRTELAAILDDIARIEQHPAAVPTVDRIRRLVDAMPQWTEATPTEIGCYWMYDTNCMVSVVEVVGDGPNPDGSGGDLYLEGYPVWIPMSHVAEVVARYWLGPIPQPPLPDGW